MRASPTIHNAARIIRTPVPRCPTKIDLIDGSFKLGDIFLDRLILASQAASGDFDVVLYQLGEQTSA